MSNKPLPHMTELRRQLLDTLADLRDRDRPMEPDRARAVAQVASVLVDSAKVEVEYLKATDQRSAPFLEVPPDQLFVPGATASPFPTVGMPASAPALAGITGVRRHVLD